MCRKQKPGWRNGTVSSLDLSFFTDAFSISILKSPFPYHRTPVFTSKEDLKLENNNNNDTAVASREGVIRVGGVPYAEFLRWGRAVCRILPETARTCVPK